MHTIGSSHLLERSGKSNTDGENISTLIENAVDKYRQGHAVYCSGKISILAKQKFIFVYFTEAKNIEIMLNYKVFGEMFKYKCHIREVRNGESTTSQCHFVHDDMQFFDHNGTIKLSASTNFETDVKLIVLSRLRSQEN